MTSGVRPDRAAQITVGLLRPCLLAHLAGSSAYGYELHQRLLAIGLECDLGTVYRCLNTMEEDGLLRSAWERSAGGRSRRRYELSDAGARMVDSYVASVEHLVAVAEAFLDLRREGGAGRSAAGLDAAAGPSRSEDEAPEDDVEGSVIGRPARERRARSKVAPRPAYGTA